MKDKSDFLEAVLLGSKQKTPKSEAQEVVVSFSDEGISPELFEKCAGALKQTIEIFLTEDSLIFTIYERKNLTSGSSLVASINKDYGRLLLVSSDDSSQAFIRLLKKNIRLAIDFEKEKLTSFPVFVVISFE